MTTEEIAAESYQAFYATAVVAGPMLLISLGIALLVGILQAATQIQDQSIPQIVKIVAVSILTVTIGIALSGPLVSHTERLYSDFPTMSR